MSDVSVIDQLIEPVTKDLGEFTVRRLLPSKRRQRIGPFIFFDHMGPADFPPGTGVNVRAHPHIGLATVTYLFEGEILHRDSLPQHSGPRQYVNGGPAGPREPLRLVLEQVLDRGEQLRVVEGLRLVRVASSLEALLGVTANRVAVRAKTGVAWPSQQRVASYALSSAFDRRASRHDRTNPPGCTRKAL